ncbi:tetratricopeptide repeat protein [bacterium BMS3Abin13]|nr:tetratricopeptide repeat protein [bacterium BMS3Abin13]
MNVQAVTYIVQRMASLAALFYVWGILNYARARMEKQRLKQYLAFSLTLVCFAAAVMSKENAITFPIAILLIELIFFQSNKNGLWRTGKYLLPLCLLSVLLIFSIMPINVSTLLDYSHRSFSLQNRLLTEPRIIVYYLSLLFYPVPARLSLLHDIQISTSLFHPFTTILAIGFLAVLGGYSLLTCKKNPIFSFAVLFFLLNHLVESTVIPLELIFEHRNYLPALFLFWPLAVIFVRGITYYRARRPSISILLAVLLTACIISSGLWTYQRNAAWKTEFSLWFDVIKKYPDLARPYQLMGVLFARTGKDKLAKKYYLLSLTKKTQTPGRSRHLVYNNLGALYLKEGKYDQAQQAFQRALDAMPGDAKSYFNLIQTLLKKGDYGETERLADLAMKMKTHRKDADLLKIKGFVLLKTGHAGEAIPYLRAARFAAPGAADIYLNLASALVKSGQYARARLLLAKATEKFGVQLRFLLLQVDNEVRHKKRQAAEALAMKIFTLYDLPAIQHALVEKPDNIAPDPALVRPVLNRVYEQQVKGMNLDP